MWRCLCGNVESSLAEFCSECGRSRDEVRPFDDSLEAIYFAVRTIMEEDPARTDQVFALLLDCVQNGMTITNIVSTLESTNDSTLVDIGDLLRIITNRRRILEYLRIGRRLVS